MSREIIVNSGDLVLLSRGGVGSFFQETFKLKRLRKAPETSLNILINLVSSYKMNHSELQPVKW